jgi:probable F420-dependent oxidoreductase
MQFGAVIELDPPAARTIQLAKLAEAHGFSHVWLYDSHVLWEEPYVIMSQVLAETRKVKVGPFVTNPATRDVTVTASTFATMNEMYGNRTICGIGRGDSAVRVQNDRPTSLKALRDSVHIIRELGNARPVEINDTTIRFPWATGSELEVWVAAYGPKALELTGQVADGFVLQLADLDIAEWMIKAVKRAAEEAGRDPESITICVGAPAYIGEDRQHMLDQNRWFGGLVGNHVADLVAKYGTESEVPKALTDYIANRTAYDYHKHGDSVSSYVPDEIVERFCIIGDADAHIEKLERLREIGVHQFAAYIQHDNKEETLRVYGEKIIPTLNRPPAAVS